MPLRNPKHEEVALAYIADPKKIGWRAYRTAYPTASKHAAETGFSRLLKNAEFAARVAELGEAATAGKVMSAQEVLEELSKLARSDMADYIRAFACGDPVEAVDRLTRAQTAALGEVTVETFMDGAGEDAREVRRLKFKLLHKTPALDLLGKHHKLYVERREIEFTGVAARLAAALERTKSGGDDVKKRPDRRAARARRKTKIARKGKRSRSR